MSGLILPAGSPLVQFRFERHAHGSSGDIPAIPLWVNRNPNPPPVFCGQTFTIHHAGDVKWESAYDGGSEAAVCLCMGSFVE